MFLVAVTSGKGGAGKSCVAGYTGLAMAEANKKTLLVEQGAGPRSLDVIIAAQASQYDLYDVLDGRCEVGEAMVASGLKKGLYLLPAPFQPRVRPDDGRLPVLLRMLQKEFDYILVDGVDFAVMQPGLFDTILLVTTPDILSIRACQSLAIDLYEQGAKNLRLVVNNVPSEVIPIHGVEDFDDIIDMIGAQLIAVIPQSPKLYYSSNNALAVDEESITVEVFDNLAARLRGQARPLLIR